MSKASQGYQQGVEAERKRCVGVLVRKARETAKTGRAFKGDVGNVFLAISTATMLYARELYGPRKGDDNGNG